jgi:hypothetical protein
MMDIFFQDPTEIPLPPEEVRIRDLQAMPWPDGKRVKVYLEVEPFQKSPNAQVQIRDRLGEVVSEVSLIETITRKMEFNMHLRLNHPGGEFQISATLYYQQVPLAGENSEETSQTMPERKVVDHRQANFTITA